MDDHTASLGVEAAVSLAAAHGLTVDTAIVLQRSNRLTVRLTPCESLARIVSMDRRAHDGAAFEVDIARRCSSVDSVVGALEPRVRPIVHVRDVFAVTFWTYYERSPGSDLAPAEYASGLERLHDELRRVTVGAPHFTDRVEEADAIVRDPSRSQQLAEVDRELLTGTLRRLRQAIVERTTTEQLLHGEPHSGNVLLTAAGVRFIDLETCCHGPIEFDLAHAPVEVGRRYVAADRLQLRDCRLLALALVAAWRADRRDAFPNGPAIGRDLVDRIRHAVARDDIDVGRWSDRRA